MESRIASLFRGADLADAYAVSIPNDDIRDINALAQSVLGQPERWFRALLSLRDAIMTCFGVKTSRQIRDRQEREGGGHIDFFPILSASDHEIVVGEDDQHLNFRTSLMLRGGLRAPDRELVVTTIVHCHNGLGRLYLSAISPIHRLVVRSSLRKAMTRAL
ncbi:conserved hypothetical protein [Beijerinckia indica subsp. indica ATCC 9039]|uniref:DUF2867 domain-containing protein n=2 Tax=Beijerinckia TaxID=532 RepID=B2IIN7_BEII9|nr:conserved hypothetical protein [Beijerinckia indica subsp. indica ATCC 9039]